jgi:hypothetical protein
MKIINLTLVFLLPSILFGQIKDTEWGEPYEKLSKDEFLKIVYESDDKQFVTIYSESGVARKTLIGQVKDLDVVNTEKLSFYVDKSYAEYNDIFYLNGKLILAIADVLDDKSNLYFQELGSDFSQIGKPKIMASYPYVRTRTMILKFFSLKTESLF